MSSLWKLLRLAAVFALDLVRFAFGVFILFGVPIYASDYADANGLDGATVGMVAFLAVAGTFGYLYGSSKEDDLFWKIFMPTWAEKNR